MPSRQISVGWFIVAAPLACLGAFLIGPQGSLSVGQSVDTVFQWLVSTGATDSIEQGILFNVRLPRVVIGFLVGAALAVSGSALQAIARNPLVAPDIAGISSGAAFGAALALTTTWLPIQASAFFFGLLAAMTTYLLASRRQRLSTVAFVLTGVVVGGIFTALLAILQALSDPLSLQGIVLWTFGNLHQAAWSGATALLLPLAISFVPLWRWRWRLNVLALGDEEAMAVGVDPRRHKPWVLAFAVLAASASVAVAGVIALVGLIVPHATRQLVGADNRRLIPAAMLAGGAFLVLVDALARAAAPIELPIGIYTTLVGGPMLLVLLRSGKLRQRED